MSSNCVFSTLRFRGGAAFVHDGARGGQQQAKRSADDDAGGDAEGLGNRPGEESADGRHSAHDKGVDAHDASAHVFAGMHLQV